jgi:hypothetical protein
MTSKIKVVEGGAGLITVPVEYRDRKFEVTYDPDFWTCEAEEQFFDGDGRYSQKLVKVVSENVKSWTLDCDLVPEAVKKLPVYLLDAVVSAMIGGVNPNTMTNSQG